MADMDHLVEVTIDPKQLDELSKRLGNMADQLPKVIVRALNRTLQRVRTRMARATAKDKGIPYALAKKRVWVKRATRNLMGGMSRAGRFGWPLRIFAPIQDKVGITTTLKGEDAAIPHAFLARSRRSGHEAVFLRRGKGRLPIDELRTRSSTAILLRANAPPELAADAQAHLMQRLIVETELLLAGKRT